MDILTRDVKQLEALLNAGLYVNTKNEEGKTLLIQFVEEGYFPFVHRLILAGASLEEATDNQSTPLHYAVAFGRGFILNKLLRLGAHVNAQNCFGNSALHIFVTNDRANQEIGLLTALFKAGIDWSLKDKDGKTAEDLAKDPIILEHLRAYRISQEKTALHEVTPPAPTIKRPSRRL